MNPDPHTDPKDLLPKDLKYPDAVYSIFEALFEDWMDDYDKVKLITETLSATGKTFRDLDNDLQSGVAQGVPVEEQVEMATRTPHHE